MIINKKNKNMKKQNNKQKESKKENRTQILKGARKFQEKHKKTVGSASQMAIQTSVS